jgi:apolipoprotein D and lipocalin family protein
MIKYGLLIVCLALSACVSIPEGIKPVSEFDVNRYIGKWFEIARLDNWFEQGLEQITAEYTLRPDGGVDVINSGYNPKDGERKYATGKAYFIGDPKVGSLKVSFFGPFYGGYHIIALDKVNYNYALIAGSDREYLWILARQPNLQTDVLQELKNQARALGFKTEKLIYPQQ